jgi:hypothetical protein
LYGLEQEEGKGKNKPKKTDAATTTAPDTSTIELDPECLQCGKDPEQVVRLFKIACLKYSQVNDIPYNGS